MAIKPTMRCLKLAILEQSGHALTTNELAAWLEVDRRTVLRYRKKARVAAAAVQEFRETLANGYEGHEKPDPALSDQETIALALAAQISPMNEMKGYRDTLEVALGKLMGRISAEMRGRIAARAEQYRRTSSPTGANPRQVSLEAALVMLADKLAASRQNGQSKSNGRSRRKQRELGSTAGRGSLGLRSLH